MIKRLAILVLFGFVFNICFAFTDPSNGDGVKVSEISGVYKEKNLYFFTPTCKTPVENELVSVKFKGRIIFETKEPRSFQVDLSKEGLMYGDEINIQVLYKGCKPFMVNDAAIEKRSSFKISDLQVSDTGLVSFKAYNEVDKFPFIIQQYKWNKWTTVAKVDGQGGENWKAYQIVSSITSGENKFRVVRYNLWKPPTMSEEFIFASKKSKPSFTFDKKSKQVTFSSKTSFKVKNEFGENVIEGDGKSIDLSEMPKGIYYIAYDNTYADVTL